ncbi:MAG: ABC transporter substrate-binding protein [Clostridiales bacterium]|nr:ABC transporter substrate-binding protein [Clostridiales bacterium]
MVLTLALPVMAEEALEGTLVVGSANFNQKFSPFYGETAYDNEISNLVQTGMLILDRNGEAVMNGIEGETRNYNGTDYTYKGIADLAVDFDEEANITTYSIKLKEGVKFSDGVELTADDLIFTYYVYMDPGYVGPTTLASYNIVGLDSYVAQVPQEIYDKLGEEFDAGYEGKDEKTWEYVTAEWKNDLQAIVDYVVGNYGSMVEDLGFTEADLEGDEGLQVALGMSAWGFASFEDGKLSGGDKTWELANEKPTIDDMYDVVYAAYEGDAVKYWDTEQADTTDVLGTAKLAYIQAEAEADPAAKDGVPNVAGVKKVDDYSVTVQTNGFQAPAMYAILGLAVAPMHYYGDKAQYDYENNQFGHPFGDLSIVEEKTSTPLGAGPYKFVEFSNKAVLLEANENYYQGEPNIKYIQYKETDNKEMAPGIQTGTIDIANVSGSKQTFDQLKGFNSNGELQGDVVYTSTVDNRGYGYIGLMATRVKVGEDAFSEESANLRKGLATIFSVYRNVVFGSYYGDAADVINYPISNVIWAAPKASDEGYKVAFSVDAEGNDIYTSEMTEDEKYAAALEAAKGFFIAAGYTFDEGTGKFTAAPEGAALQYEIWIPADGTGDHPTFAVLTYAKNALAEIGFDLIINDLSQSQKLWDGLKTGDVDMWCAAWQNNNPDPDMYQIYHSNNIPGKGGSDSNHYRFDIAKLDELIMEGRTSPDMDYRKPIYKEALDIIVDSAVEIPAYQRQNAMIFSSERINIDTLTPDITTWWDWYNDIHLLELK